ncbi:tRNA epoxyqueuosine(34) reductase QueG [Neomegalonema perideroedes]|uniref:tRNA epoxyqueuosine(34) reductase QueG n=1 Tax=Neomegalonema perideroedes TaxID=217219 RepID=UPI000374A04E|nr:tRNA epoxyqueuosine(34) reductase QueG [Neomegalonema perideroedes]
MDALSPAFAWDPVALEALKTELRGRAEAEGFADFGICAPDAIPEAPERLRRWLEGGAQGDMLWMKERTAQRSDPRELWPEARAVIMLAENYGPGPGHDPLKVLKSPECGGVATYAQGEDYHDVVKKKIKRLARWLAETTGEAVKVFVDTAPVMEKPLAAAAGLGWQGKHTNLVSRKAGSWTFLAAIYTSTPLPPDGPSKGSCGSCRKCLDSCPTGAFPAPYQLDARRCVSYLTIEHKGPIPHEFRKPIGNRIYGCDDCLAVCPWNKYAKAAHEMAYRGVMLQRPMLAHFLQIESDEDFREIFAKSPIKRIGRGRFLRNVLIAAGNSGLESLIPLVRERLADSDPVTRGAAVWALAQLLPRPEFAALAAARAPDPDPEAEAEWGAALERDPNAPERPCGRIARPGGIRDAGSPGFSVS